MRKIEGDKPFAMLSHLRFVTLLRGVVNSVNIRVNIPETLKYLISADLQDYKRRHLPVCRQQSPAEQSCRHRPRIPAGSLTISA